MENVCKSLALDMKKYDEKVGLCVESTRTWMTDIIAVSEDLSFLKARTFSPLSIAHRQYENYV